MIMTMTVNNWLEMELVLQEKDPTMTDMVSIATQWQSAEDAVAQFIDNETSKNDSDSEEADDIDYRAMSNRKKGPATGNLDSDYGQPTIE